MRSSSEPARRPVSSRFIFNTMGLEVFLLTLVVLTLGMLALRQFANMRHKLELIVAERTQKLEEKSRELEVLATRDNLTGLFNRRYGTSIWRARWRLVGASAGR
jgi:predicted signal transduction protein with EAL and GGDEF domain